MEDWTSKAVVTSIRATSRASIKIKDSFYTVEWSEERAIPDIEGVDIEMERAALWKTANSECDKQIDEIIDSFKK